MAITNHNWYSRNSIRGYPLDDRATRTGDLGERLPNGILVDVNLRFPRSAGRHAWVSSLSVTSTLVTATFLATADPDNAPSEFRPLAVVTVRKPIQIGRPYALDSMIDGTAGWIVFGSVDEPFSARFSSPLQGLLLARCARAYTPPPISSLVKRGVALGLKGVVNLQGGSDIEVIKGERFVDGRLRDVIVVRLKSFSNDRNVLDAYKGPCGNRPETGNCDKPGIEFINTVGPDCNGNIQIQFPGETLVGAYPGSSEGLILDYPIGLTEACTHRDRLPDSDGKLPDENTDPCVTEYEDHQSSDVYVEVP